uniref:Actin-related protein 8 n=1 Tax=Nothobranchius pienaari TaxID=704102 RepID=A0A1A8MXQ4_9TELE
MTQAEKEVENGKEKEKDRDKEKEKEQQRGVKRPIAPAAIAEPLQEQIQSNFVIVIHPGSRTVRIGRATDTVPITIPHVIARRHKQSGQPRYEDTWLLREGLNKPESNEQRQNGLKMVDQAIWSKKMSNGMRRTPVSAEQARAYNCQIRPAVLDSSSRVKWTNTSHHPAYLVGDEAVYVNPSDCYNVHWPVVRGQLNVHSGSGGSLTAVLADLETIWSHVIQKHLDIPLKDLKYYRCILLVPDIYNRQHIKEMVSMLLLNMGFSAIIVHQESVCATFGSGLSSACVVDVGDQKTSVCCVEDGVSHRNSRLCLAYGGSDVTRTFFWHLQRAGFPYRDCQLTSRLDCQLLQHLKENVCHLNQVKTAIISQFESKALGLDKAILHSIDCCASDETKRKMYSSILVVGGGLMFHGAQEFLLHRIINKMPPSFRRLVDNVEVITRPKDMDPRLISWKGGAVLACLDTTQEMWIHQREWQRFGVRMLRERAAFVWNYQKGIKKLSITVAADEEGLQHCDVCSQKTDTAFTFLILLHPWVEVLDLQDDLFFPSAFCHQEDLEGLCHH